VSLVGDVLMSAREMFPDLPVGKIPAPASELNALTAVATPAGYVSLPAATNYFVITYLNPWGETLFKAEQSLAIGANQTAQLTGAFPTGVIGVRVYQGLSAGSEAQQFFSSSLPFIINGGAGVAGIPPTISSAFLPDTDGRAVSAASVYRWLGEAFDKAGLTTKGVRDQTGVGTVNGQGAYVLPGRWTKIDNCWFDGWLMSRDGTLNFFYHNVATGISWILDVTKITNTGLTVAIWPQANRTSGQTTLSASMLATDSVASLTASSSFLSLGLAQIGTEIVEYGPTGTNQLLNLQRGLGGSSASAWPAGTPVTELNLRIQGLRLPNKPVIGSAYQTLDLPYGWEAIMSTYLLHKFREAEQDRQSAADLLKEFLGMLTAMARSNRQLSGPVQIGGNAREVYGGGLGGGWMVP
jgi:hypothetical protein